MSRSLDDLLRQLLSIKLGIKLGLERISDALAEIGHPERNLPPVVHVAGTNGKGSTLAFLTALAEASGLRVHRYTSPHLVRFHERIYVAGQEIGDEELRSRLEAIIPLAEKFRLTFFEATTLAAFLAFSEHDADLLLLETGLGGRLDATNLVPEPALTCITQIDYDHQEFLGDTLAQIAAEKAGIIKQGRPCVVMAQQAEALQVLENVARQKNARLITEGQHWHVAPVEGSFEYVTDAEHYALPLPALTGEHQLHNAGAAISCALELQRQGLLECSAEVLAKAMQGAFIAARMQRVCCEKLSQHVPDHCELWVDGGHNAVAGRMIGKHIATHWAGKRVCVVLAMKQDKNVEGFLSAIMPNITALMHVDVTSEAIDQVPEHVIEAVARAHDCPFHAIDVAEHDMLDALAECERYEPDIILVTGSLYLAGKLLSYTS